MTMEEIAGKLASNEQKITGLEHRVKDVEQLVEQIHELTTSVKLLAHSVEMMAEEQKAQGQRLTKLEEEPGERWNSAKKTMFNTVVGAISGAVVTGLLALIAQYI